eukprot:7317395-Pyramimonas_sp.AAC.1
MGNPPTTCIWGCPGEIAHYLKCPRMFHHLAMHQAWRRRHFPGASFTLLGMGWATDYESVGSELTRAECLRAVVLAYH